MAKSCGLSVCMIVKNEEANIAGALAGFTSFADEIIVVDTGSSDNTKEIAAGFTSKIYDFEWIDDFSAARNFAASKAAKGYQLWVDADDRIPPEARGHIGSLKSYFDGRKAFYFRLETLLPNAPASTCMQLRCIPVRGDVRFEGRVHEQIFPSAIRAGLELVTTDIVVRHLGYTTVEVQTAKALRNLAIMEKEKAEGRDDGALNFFLAMTYGPLGKHEEAARSMEAALRHFEKERFNNHLVPEGRLFLAKLAFEMKDREKCLRYLARARDLTDGNPHHNFEMGIICQRMGRHHEALEFFGKVSRKQYAPSLFPTKPPPSDSELLLHMAYSFHCISDYQNALKAVLASAGPANDVGRSWVWLGTKAFLFENMQLAALAYETAMGYGALDPAGLRRLGYIYKAGGFPQKAQECFARAGGEAVV
jgi:glycosyltransferase involved in cell wall biosynthesis